MKYKFFHLVILSALIARHLPSKVLSAPFVTLLLSNLGVDDVEARGWGGDGRWSRVDSHYEGLLDG